jgi:SAM-dependent methyltransferase
LADPVDVESALEQVARSFPEEMIEEQLWDLPRVAFNTRLIVDRVGTDVRVCDIGAGVGMFGAGCARLGMHMTLMDDFAHPYADAEMAAALPDVSDAINFERAERVLELHRAAGVAVMQRDPLTEGFGFPPQSLEVVTTFGSMEHWHHSPKQLFAAVMEALVPGGLFVLSAPNCVSFSKRIKVPLGLAKWSRMADWYEAPRFRGHVREPDVADLRYIARDMGLDRVEILGRNWIGQLSQRPVLRATAGILDRVLRPWPTLCSDLYLVGRKPGSRAGADGADSDR